MQLSSLFPGRALYRQYGSTSMADEKREFPKLDSDAASRPDQRPGRRFLGSRSVRPVTGLVVGGRSLPRDLEMAVLSFLDLSAMHSLHLASLGCRSIVVAWLESPNLT